MKAVKAEYVHIILKKKLNYSSSTNNNKKLSACF